MQLLNEIMFCIVLAPAFHLLRASLTAGSVARREYPELRLHPVAGAPLPWHEAAQHSQGALGTRADFIDAELGRIARYTAKGDILPWRELETFFAACER
ncbi:unnamed protein product [Prorocentrum cordatum]|uniref:Uncharacterized protein n=1 Tax=Prorocentrum cordatum TaxID=2364126 RepID=A0ABN9PMJ2_9DINO|nr:unnamed protein product [Polarella glacialis]